MRERAKGSRRSEGVRLNELIWAGGSDNWTERLAVWRIFSENFLVAFYEGTSSQVRTGFSDRECASEAGNKEKKYVPRSAQCTDAPISTNTGTKIRRQLLDPAQGRPRVSFFSGIVRKKNLFQ